jgi:hypothetical protein
MWGSWFIATLGATVGLALLVIGFAFGGWPVLVALGIFAIVGVAMLAGASWRRSGEYVERGDEAEASSERADHGTPSSQTEARPRSGGAPASGEGG